jgi:hypothetical protein
MRLRLPSSPHSQTASRIDENTPLAYSTEQKPGELAIITERSGPPQIDQAVSGAVGAMHRLAKVVSASKQREVTTVIDTMRLQSLTIQSQQQAIEARASEVGMARQLITNRR